jgi:hypothetical protein
VLQVSPGTSLTVCTLGLALAYDAACRLRVSQKLIMHHGPQHVSCFRFAQTVCVHECNSLDDQTAYHENMLQTYYVLDT